MLDRNGFTALEPAGDDQFDGILGYRESVRLVVTFRADFGQGWNVDDETALFGRLQDDSERDIAIHEVNPLLRS